MKRPTKKPTLRTNAPPGKKNAPPKTPNAPSLNENAPTLSRDVSSRRENAPSETTSVSSAKTAALGRESRPTTTVFVALSAAFFVFDWYFWGVRYGDFLFQLQESGNFLFGGTFFWNSVAKPGGFLVYAISLIDRLFYFPPLGGAVLATVFAAIRSLGTRLFAAKSDAPPNGGANGAAFYLALLVSATLTIAATWRGYSICVPFEPTAPLIPIFGTLVALTTATVYRTIASPRRRLVFAVATVAFGYPLFGFWALLGALLSFVQETLLAPNAENANVSNSKRRAPFFDKKLRTETLLLATLAFPLGWYWFAFYRRVRYGDVFWTPTFEPRLAEKWGVARTSALVGWVALVATTLSAPFVVAKIGARKPRSKNRLRIVFPFVFSAATAFVVWFGSFGDANFFALLACGRALDDENWNEILRIEATTSRPSAPLVGLRNLALFQTDSLGEKAFERPVDGVRTAPTSEPARLEIRAPEIALYFGQINVGTRLATNSFVASDDRSTAFLKTLAVAEIAAGNVETARNYLTLLEKTPFYRPWALRYRRFLDDSTADDATTRSIAAQIEKIRRLKPQNDRFVVEFPNPVFLDGLGDAPWETATPRELEIRLTNLLARRRPQEFADRLEEVASRFEFESKPFGGELPIPKHFQEAYLLATAPTANRERSAKIAIAPEIEAAFADFQRFRADVDPSTLDGRRRLFERFGATYWGYYFDDSTTSANKR